MSEFIFEILITCFSFTLAMITWKNQQKLNKLIEEGIK